MQGPLTPNAITFLHETGSSRLNPDQETNSTSPPTRITAPSSCYGFMRRKRPDANAFPSAPQRVTLRRPLGHGNFIQQGHSASFARGRAAKGGRSKARRGRREPCPRRSGNRFAAERTENLARCPPLAQRVTSRRISVCVREGRALPLGRQVYCRYWGIRIQRRDPNPPGLGPRILRIQLGPS